MSTGFLKVILIISALTAISLLLMARSLEGAHPHGERMLHTSEPPVLGGIR